MERYRHENGIACIDIGFHEIKQLYDGRDPAPFRERDLDEDLVRYLLVSAEEIPRNEPVKVVLKNSSASLSAKEREDFAQALHQFFAHEDRVLATDLKNLFQQGRMSLILGILFLVTCTAIAMRVSADNSLIGKTIHEGLSLMGWVALWKPINIFLYEWWPILKKRRTMQRLAKIQIEFSS